MFIPMPIQSYIQWVLVNGQAPKQEFELEQDDIPVSPTSEVTGEIYANSTATEKIDDLKLTVDGNKVTIEVNDISIVPEGAFFMLVDTAKGSREVILSGTIVSTPATQGE